MSDKKEPAKVVIAPKHKMTIIREQINRDGKVVMRRVEEPKDKN